MSALLDQPTRPIVPPVPVAPDPRRAGIVVAAMLVSTFMAAVEVTVISTAMPTIVARLGGFSLFSWAFGIYLLAQAVTTPIYGRLADTLGRRPVYLGAAGLFLVGSLLCGCAWSMGSLILFRAVQGLGGGGLVPLAATIIGDVAAPSDRPRLMGYVSGIWGVAAVIGPLLGALFVGSLGWPFVFWINLPFGLVAMALVLRFLHEPERAVRPAGRSIDAVGSGLLVVGVGAVMTALVQVESFSLPEIAGLVALGAVVLAVFAWRERRRAEPLIATYLLRRPMILAANASSLLCGVLMIGYTAFLPTWIQGVTGLGALEAGLVLGAMLLSWTGASMGLGRLLVSRPPRPVAWGGGALMVLGAVGLLLAPGGPLSLALAGVPLGAGLGLTSLVFTVAVQSGVEQADRGRSVALFYFCRLIGQAVGAAAFGGVLNAGLARSLGAGAEAQGAVRMLVGAARSTLDQPELQRLVAALAGALHGVFALAAVVSLGALAVTVLVPRDAKPAHEWEPVHE